MAAPTFAALPNKEVAKGDKWDATSTLDMGPIGKYVNKFTYTYDGKNTEGKDDAEKKWDKIKVTTELTYTPPDEKAQAGGLPFKIKSADLTSKDANGTIYYDADKGRIPRSTMNLTLKGTLSIESGGQTTPVKLSQTQDTNVRDAGHGPDEAVPGEVMALSESRDRWRAGIYKTARHSGESRLRFTPSSFAHRLQQPARCSLHIPPPCSSSSGSRSACIFRRQMQDKREVKTAPRRYICRGLGASPVSRIRPRGRVGSATGVADSSACV